MRIQEKKYGKQGKHLVSYENYTHSSAQHWKDFSFILTYINLPTNRHQFGFHSSWFHTHTTHEMKKKEINLKPAIEGWRWKIIFCNMLRERNTREKKFKFNRISSGFWSKIRLKCSSLCFLYFSTTAPAASTSTTKKKVFPSLFFHPKNQWTWAAAIFAVYIKLSNFNLFFTLHETNSIYFAACRVSTKVLSSFCECLVAISSLFKTRQDKRGK